MELTRRDVLALGLGALVFPKELGAAAEFSCLGAPPELAHLTFPEPRLYIETQDWWVQGNTGFSVPQANFPFISSHVHLGVPFPIGERVVLPSSGPYTWHYLAQYHNNIGAVVRSVRGGGFQLDSCCVTDPNWKGVKINAMDVRHVGTLVHPISAWRTKAGTFENRFTADTTSSDGQKQYQSGAWNAQLGIAGAPVGITGRGWYQTADYTNVSESVKVRASTGLPNTLGINMAQGAKWGFAYIDANIHAGQKGTVLFENRTTVGPFTLPSLTPGNHVLLMGAWEKVSNGWNCGVLRIPFRR